MYIFIINLSISRHSKHKAGLNGDLADLNSFTFKVNKKLLSAGDLRESSQRIIHVWYLPGTHHRVCPPVQLHCGAL